MYVCVCERERGGERKQGSVVVLNSQCETVLMRHEMRERTDQCYDSLIYGVTG